MDVKEQMKINVVTKTNVLDILVQKREKEHKSKSETDACSVDKVAPAAKKVKADKASVEQDDDADADADADMALDFIRSGEVGISGGGSSGSINNPAAVAEHFSKMGFSKDEVAAALASTNQNVCDAVLLLSKPTGSGPADIGGWKPKSPVEPALQNKLCAAAAGGKLDDVRVLVVENGANPGVPGDDPLLLPMYFAAKGGHVDVVTLLLKYGADVHIARIDCGATSLFLAAQQNHVVLVATLLKQNADPNLATTDDGQTPLSIASQQGHLLVVAMLLAHNADPNLADTDDGHTPLWIASGSGKADVVEMLVKHKADPNKGTRDDGSTPLLIAAQFNNANVIATLLKHSNANPNQSTTDKWGATPLCIAAGGGHVEVVTELLNSSKTNADKPMVDDGSTAVCMAAQEGHAGIVEMLLKVGKADPNQARTDSGATPLCMAAQEGHVDVVAVLLNVGKADPNLEMTDGPSPLDIAEEAGHKEIAHLLRQEGGRVSSNTADMIATQAAKRNQLPDITLKTSTGDYTAKFVVWAGGEFQYPRSIPHTLRVGHGTGYASYADLPRGKHVVIGGSESGIDITHFLVGLGDTVTILDADAPWNSHESDSSYGLSPYTFDRLRTLQASGKVTFIAERADSITPTEIKTKSHTLSLTNLAIDATGFDITKSIAGKLFNFEDGVPRITRLDESTVCENVFLVGPHVQHNRAVFCFIYKYRQRFAVVAKEMLARLGAKGAPIIQEYAKKNFLLEDLSECDSACAC